MVGRNVTGAARLAAHTLLWFMLTSLIAVVVGLALGLLTDPGGDVRLQLAGTKTPEKVGTWLDFLT